MRTRLFGLLVLWLSVVGSAGAFERPQKSDVINIVHRVNQTWQQRHPTHGDFFWNRAAYYIGNMHAYEVTGTKAYLDYATAWAEHNQWRGREGSDDPTQWRWSYGEGYNYVLFGDNQVCFQVYADLYALDPDHDPQKIARALEVMGYEVSTDREDYIWWVDGLFMVMPVLSKLYKITGDEVYLEKMFTYWKWYTDRMWDDEEGLYYRDASYVYPSHATLSGKKDFWARGCGWVFAALAKVLQDIPQSDSHRSEYISYFRRMAAALKRCQQSEGYWERSLIDPGQAPGYETSGTAFFAYGFAWGIGSGILSEEEYGETLQKAWHYLTTIALQGDGTVGYIQPIGSQAIPGQYLYPSSYYDFGVGAFLMAASEMSKLAVGNADIGTPQSVASVAVVGSGTSFTVRFVNDVDTDDALSLSHYRLDGQVLDNATARLADSRTVNITLDEPLGYGQHRLEVDGVHSGDGGAMAAAYLYQFFVGIALDEPQTDLVVTAIGAQAGNPPANAVDGNYATRWSQDGRGQWLQLELPENRLVTAVDLAFYNGDKRRFFFDIQVAGEDGLFATVLPDQASCGLTNELERFTLPQPCSARFIRVVCNKNSQNEWNSITEVRLRYQDGGQEGTAVRTVTTKAASRAYDMLGRPANHTFQRKVIIGRISSGVNRKSVTLP